MLGQPNGEHGREPQQDEDHDLPSELVEITVVLHGETLARAGAGEHRLDAMPATAGV